MEKTAFAKFVSMTAACFMAEIAAHAGTAIWQGGATGDINNPDNWNAGANLTTDYLNFGQDVTATMSADTAVFDVFGNKKSDADYADRNIVFNMGGHTLRAIGADGAGKQYIVGTPGTTYVFTNGTFWCSTDGSVTNSLYTHGSNTTTNMSIVAIGENTTLVSGFALKCSKNIGLYILNGAKAYGSLFGLGHSSEFKGGKTEVCFTSSCGVGPTESSAYNTDASETPHGSVLLVDGATLTSEDPATKGSIYVGYGSDSYDNAIIATNGATLAANNIRVGLNGLKNNVLYTSSNNTFKATGAGTTITVPGNGNIRCGDGGSSGNQFLLDRGATAAARYIYVGNGSSNCTASNNTFKATGAGTAVLAPAGNGDFRCGVSLSHGNHFLVEDGAAVTNVYQFYVGSGAASNNTFKAGGTGTKVGTSRFIVGGYDAACADSFGNLGVLEENATLTGTALWVNVAGSRNVMAIRSGATATVSDDVCLGGRSQKDYLSDCGASGLLEIVGEGTSLTCGKNFIIRNSTGDASKGQEVLVGDGASLTHNNNNGFRLFGEGNRVVVSNGTLTVNTLCANGSIVNNVVYPATNSTFRIVGASAKLIAERTKDCDGDGGRLVGAPIFEFVIPQGGWASAPVAINQAFSIGDDTVIRIDAASARAFAKAGSGTVPLISTGTSGKTISADIDKLTASADLPAGCSLQNYGGVLSVNVKACAGMTIIVR